jgi:hypothetical protein
VPEAARGEAGDTAMALTAVGPLIDIVGEIAPHGERGRRRAAGRMKMNEE